LHGKPRSSFAIHEAIDVAATKEVQLVSVLRIKTDDARGIRIVGNDHDVVLPRTTRTKGQEAFFSPENPPLATPEQPAENGIWRGLL
jgi:hypothetical protein